MSRLLLLFVVPFAASLIAFVLLPFTRRWGKPVAVILSLVPLAILLINQPYWIGSSIKYAWIAPLAVNFHLAVDPISLVFLYLTAVIIPICLLAASRSMFAQSNVFYGLTLLLQGLLIGFFTSRDLVLFTLLWEGMLIPLFFVILLWGGQKRSVAAMKFLVYMVAGSTLMVAGVLALHFAALAKTGVASFNFELLARTAQTAPGAGWIFLVFMFAFAVKTPLFPFHGWLADAYVQAPTSGSILLAAVLSKAGIYGVLRIGKGFFPTLMVEWSGVLLTLAIIGVLYGALAAWVQSDFKRLIAYSSFSHVNFILVGLFITSRLAQDGAVLQSLNHAITICALFLAAGWLEERIGTTAISRFSGVARVLPQLCWLTLLFVLSSVALPGTNSFVGELMIFLGLFKIHPWATAVLATSVILSVIYMLRWMQKVYFESAHHVDTVQKDIGFKEWGIALPLVFLILWIGIYPTPVLQQIQSVKVVAVAKE